MVDKSKFPDWADLFLTPDLCTCKDCRSVLSPAAYFVDLLHFLDPDVWTGSKPKPINVLLSRRPDLENIQLTCENTNTEIPYVDLINEILESYVVYGLKTPYDPENPITLPPIKDSSPKVTSQELAANPENTSLPAYATLNQTVYPITLPFNRPVEIMRTYLNFLGSSRYEMMKMFATDSLQIVSPMNGDTVNTSTVVITGVSSDTISKVELSIDVGPYSLANGTAFWTYNTSALSNGPHTITARVTNMAGNTETISTSIIVNATSGSNFSPIGFIPLCALAGESFLLTWNEYQIVTGRNLLGRFNSADAWVGSLFDSGSVSIPTGKNWNAGVSQVQEFLQRTGIDYTNLVDLLKTLFINPEQDYPTLAVIFTTINSVSLFWNAVNGATNYSVSRSVSSNGPFTEITPGGITGTIYTDTGLASSATYYYKVTATIPVGSATSNVVSAIAQASGSSSPPPDAMTQAIVLYSHDTSCDLTKTCIKYGGGNVNPLSTADLFRMHRFIRLWKKTGWAIEDLDKAMTALHAGDITDEFMNQLADVKQLQSDLKMPLVQLLSFWNDVDIHGDNAIYKKLFLNKAVRSINYGSDSFALQNGSVVTGQKISDQIFQAVQAALNINANDLINIMTYVNLNITGPPDLNLANLSLLYRHAILVKALKMPVSNFFDCIILTGINPFDSPRHAIQFIKKVKKIQNSKFSVKQMNYLYRHLYDPNSTIVPSQDAVIQLAKALRDGLKKIIEDNVMISDPTGDLLKHKLGLIWDSTVVDQTISMLDGSAIYASPLDNLSNTTLDSFPQKLSYDGNTKSLKYSGAMSTQDKAALELLDSSPDYAGAIEEIFQQPRSFMKNTLSVFLDPVYDVEILLDNQPLSPSTTPPSTEEKFDHVLALLLPYLQNILSFNLVKQTVSSAFKIDADMAGLLLQNLLDIQTPSGKVSCMKNFLSISNEGLSADYFNSKDLSGDSVVSRVDPQIGFQWGTNPQNTTPDPKITSPFSVRWQGKILVQYDEPYTFWTKTHDGINLSVDNQQIIANWKDQPNTENQSRSVELHTGQLYDIKMEYYVNDNNGVAELWWSSPSTAKSLIPQNALYVDSFIDAFSASFILLHKVAMLVNAFDLNGKEIDYISANSHDFSQFDLNELPLDRSNAAAVDGNSVSLFNQWERLYDFTALRNNTVEGTLDLIDVFESDSFGDATSNLAQVMNWDKTELDFMIDYFNLNDLQDTFANKIAFKNEIWPSKLQKCMTLNKKLGISTAQIKSDSWAIGETNDLTAQDFVNVVKAQYDNDQWLTISKPLTDKLRNSQRSALVAYLIPKIDDLLTNDSNGLFQYFLIDVDMGTCMTTSRIAQGILTVQTFVQRCLMNLEEDVEPTSIDTTLWAWMKSYQTWEPNREIFLYPENWMAPELRHDKSPFFTELQTDLLQNDITQDTAETAILSYLEKLEHVARLEICGMYWQYEDHQTGEATNILHVFGRTFETPHIYYYRQWVDQSTWTPWERMNLDITNGIVTDNDTIHLLPVIYNRQLYLFWPVFAEKSDTITNISNTPSTPKMHLEISLAWSKYKQNKWTPKQISGTHYKSPNSKDKIRDFAFAPTIDSPNSVTAPTLKIHLIIADNTSNDMYNKATDFPIFVIGTDGNIELIDEDPRVRDFDIYLYAPVETYLDAMELVEDIAEGLTFIIDYNGNKISTLSNSPYVYRILFSHQFNNALITSPQDSIFQYPFQPFFYQDLTRTYFILPERIGLFSRFFNRNLAAFISPSLSHVPVKQQPVFTGGKKPDSGDPVIFSQDNLPRQLQVTKQSSRIMAKKKTFTASMGDKIGS